MCHMPARTLITRSPFDEVDSAFLTLAASGLTLPITLPSESGVTFVWSVDRVRVQLAHPATDASTRALVWAEIVRRYQAKKEPWGTVAVAMVLPALRRALARFARPQEVEQCDLEQEVLTAVMVEFAGLLATAASHDPGLALIRAGDRVAHRVVYAALTARRTAPVPLDEELTVQPVQFGGSDAQVYAVLDRAVENGVLSELEAELIGAMRLEKKSAASCAQTFGMSVRTVFRRRSEAEQRLVEALKSLCS